MNSTRTYRLAESTLVEPLVNSWHAWTYLIAPVPAGFHLMHYQIPTMESYLANPAEHDQASRDPALVCGPFIGVAPERARQVRELLETTKDRQENLLRLAKAVREFHDWIVREGRGQSLEPYYRQAPEELRGYIELVYDYYNRPTVRFLEGMLYRSDYYDPGLQSLRLSRLERETDRTFFISTPRVLLPGQIDWAVPFADSRLDELYKLDFEPQPLGRVRELLGLTEADDERLLPLLTEEPPPAEDRWDGDTPRVRYVGHACVLVEWKGVSILTDAFIPVMPVEGGIERLTFQRLPRRIDYALITHNHQDHFSLETLLRLRHRIGSLVVPRTFGISYGDTSLKLLLQTLGFTNVSELDTFETIPLPDGEIVALPFVGEHADLPHGKSAFMVRAGQERVLFAADSDCLDRRMYDIVRRTWGRIQTVFLGTENIGAPLDWVYGPMLGEKPQPQDAKTRRQHGCDACGAMEMIEAVGARRIYNYALGLEPWMEYMLGLGLHEESPQIIESNRLLARARGRGLLTATRTFGTLEVRLGRPPAPGPDQLNFWKLQLAGTPPPLDLGRGVGPRTAAADSRGRLPLNLPAQLSDALRSFSEREGVDLTTTLLAAFQSLLHLYTGREDIVVWALFKNRGHDGPEPPAGKPVNAVALRTDLSGEPTFRAILRRAARVAATARAHADVPFDTLRRELRGGAERGDGVRGGAAQAVELRREVLFVFDDAAGAGDDRQDVELTFVVSEDDGGEVGGHVEYRSDLYDEPFVALLLENYRALLAELAADPARALAEIPLGRAEAAGAGGGASDAEVEFQF